MLRKIKQISKKTIILFTIITMLSIYLPILSSISFALNSISLSTMQEYTANDISDIVKNIPKYYVFDMEHFHDQECSIGDYTTLQLENYIEELINDDSIEISVENLEGGGNFTFMEWGADVNILKNGELYGTVHLGWDDGSQITAFALITIPSNIEKTEEAYITYAQNIIENTYDWTYPYKIEKSEQLKNKEIVLLDTEKFGTVKYRGEDIISNLYTFTPQDDLSISEPLLLMQDDTVQDTENDISDIVKNIPKYYVFDMEHFHNQECSIGDYTTLQLEKYIEEVINDDTIEISVENLEGGGNFTFMEWGADVNILKNGELYDTVRLGWEDGSQITTFALITIPSNIEETEEAYITYAQNIIENEYDWNWPYKIEKNSELIDKEIVLLDTEKFGTIKYRGEDIISNLYNFIPVDELEIPEPLLLIQENVDSITLNPEKPLVAVGETLDIIATTEPTDIESININWYSSDESIVTVNNNGQIKGIKKGNATITAQIKDVSQSIDVSVYEIATYVSDEENSKNVINTANRIIKNMITNGDISNTDIIDKDRIIEEMQDAAKKGYLFRVDVGYAEKSPNQYDPIRHKIISEFSGYDILGGQEITVMMSYQDNNGIGKGIGNITELDSELDINFRVPTYIAEPPINKKREYKLIRCHGDDMTSIEFEINNGMVEAKSSKFSDFILLYKDVEIPTFDISGTITSYDTSSEDNVWIQLYREGEQRFFTDLNVTGKNSNYLFKGIPAGNYTIKFVKNYHVVREIDITVDNSNIIRDVQLCLIGDINGDGKVNIKDWNKLYNHINETNIITDYQLLCADVNEDGKVNIKDWNRLYNHITEVSPLW